MSISAPGPMGLPAAFSCIRRPYPIEQLTVNTPVCTVITMTEPIPTEWADDPIMRAITMKAITDRISIDANLTSNDAADLAYEIIRIYKDSGGS